MGENMVYDNQDTYGTFFDDATSETSLLNNDRYVLIYKLMNFIV